jgi:hypothetical protein
MIAEAMPWKSPLVRGAPVARAGGPFPSLLSIFHFLKPELNSEHLISEYQLAATDG